MVQPAPRSSTAPAPKSASMRRSGNEPASAASAIDQKQGQASSQVPACHLIHNEAPCCTDVQTAFS